MSNFIDVIYIQENISVLNQSKTNHNVEGCFDVFEPIQLLLWIANLNVINK